jgi:hypothetical protein
MSQPDLERTLRTIRPAAPPELRERVRAIAAQPAPARRLVGRRRSLALAVPLAAALAAALVAVLTRGNGPSPAPTPAAKDRAAAPAIVKSAGALAAAGSDVRRVAQSLGGRVVSTREVAGAVEYRLRFPASKARAAVGRLALLPRARIVHHRGSAVWVRVSRP